jgi:hypothetical protein
VVIALGPAVGRRCDRVWRSARREDCMRDGRRKTGYACPRRRHGEAVAT